MKDLPKKPKCKPTPAIDPEAMRMVALTDEQVGVMVRGQVEMCAEAALLRGLEHGLSSVVGLSDGLTRYLLRVLDIYEISKVLYEYEYRIAATLSQCADDSIETERRIYDAVESQKIRQALARGDL